jgi:hypothetical protein
MAHADPRHARAGAPRRQSTRDEAWAHRGLLHCGARGRGMCGGHRRRPRRASYRLFARSTCARRSAHAGVSSTGRPKRQCDGADELARPAHAFRLARRKRAEGVSAAGARVRPARCRVHAPSPAAAPAASYTLTTTWRYSAPKQRASVARPLRRAPRVSTRVRCPAPAAGARARKPSSSEGGAGRSG